MKKIIQREIYQYVCDECKKDMGFPVIEICFSYGSKKDGTFLEFCSDECFKKYVEELKTEGGKK